MTITEMRNYLQLSRVEFSRRYQIPVRTLEDWEAGRSTPPAYVRRLLEESVRKDEMIEIALECESRELLKKMNETEKYAAVKKIARDFAKKYPRGNEWCDECLENGNDYLDVLHDFITSRLETI